MCGALRDAPNLRLLFGWRSPLAFHGSAKPGSPFSARPTISASSTANGSACKSWRSAPAISPRTNLYRAFSTQTTSQMTITPTNEFCASVHVGRQGALTDELTDFNRTLETIPEYLKRGCTLSDVAVYLPTEDAWVAGEYPKELQVPWGAWGACELFIFFAQPLARDLTLPLRYGQSLMETPMQRTVRIRSHGRTQEVKLVFEPYQSLLLKVDRRGEIEFIDIRFVPKTPRTSSQRPATGEPQAG